MPNGIKIFGGRSNQKLTKDICAHLGLPVGKIEIRQFADHELWVQYQENIRGSDVFLVQSTSYPVNDNLMELMLMINAARLASAKRVTVVFSYYGYARQDRKDRPRVALSAKVVASMLQSQHIKRILALDLHSAPIQGFFDIPVDHVYALPVFLQQFKDINKEKTVIVSPDAGGVTRARMMSNKMGVPLAIVDKNRVEANIAEVMNVIGDVNGKDCLMVDDMIDTAGTLCKGAVALMEHGARSVRAAASHGVFSYDAKEGVSALEKIANSPLEEVYVTDSIPQESNLHNCGINILEHNDDYHLVWKDKLFCLSVAPLLGNAIKAIHDNESVSSLFA